MIEWMPRTGPLYSCARINKRHVIREIVPLARTDAQTLATRLTLVLFDVSIAFPCVWLVYDARNEYRSPNGATNQIKLKKQGHGGRFF